MNKYSCQIDAYMCQYNNICKTHISNVIAIYLPETNVSVKLHI